MYTHPRTKSLKPLGCVGLIVVSLAVSAAAQDVTNALNIGLPPNGVFTGSDFDSVQVNNGNLHLEIPLWSTPGRGFGVGYSYVYDSKGWSFRRSTDGQGLTHDTVIKAPGNNLVLRLAFSPSYSAGGKSVLQKCNSVTYLTYTNFVLTESRGTKHHFLPDPIARGGASCWPTVSTLYADDGSGWILNIDTSTGLVNSAIAKDGTVQYLGTGAKLEDSNGNELMGGMDTLGRTYPTDGSYYDSSGTLRSTVVTPQPNVQLQTALCPLSDADYCNEASPLSSPPGVLQLPNGMTYTFTYDLQGGPTHPYYGQPLSVSLPTGGQIIWAWSGAADGGPAVTSRTLSGDPAPWLYTPAGVDGPPGATSTGTVTDPAGNDTRSTCTFYGQGVTSYLQDGICFITTVQYYKGSYTAGTLLKTVVTDYQNTANTVGNNGPVLPIRETTTWNDSGNQVRKVETDWDSMSLSTGGTFSWRNPTERREFDYGTGLPGTQVRTTDYTYLHWPTSSAYRTANIADRVTSKIVHSGTNAGTIVAQTNYAYDGTTPVSTNGAAPNHDYVNFDSSHNLRGNLTQTSQWLKRIPSWLNTNNTYDDLGNRLTTTDPGLHQTSFDYTDSWQDTACTLGSNTFAYLTKVTDAAAHQTKHSYFRCTGLKANTKDQNDITNGGLGTSYSYDLMNRVGSVSYPDGGLISKLYTDTVPPSVQTTQLITTTPSTLSLVKTTIVDGLGRVAHTQLQDPDCTSGPVTADYSYGYTTSNNTSFTSVTNPYCGASTGTTTTTSDALNRVSSVQQADGSTVSTTYLSNTATVTDEAGKQRKTQTDGLGRLTFVWEDPAVLNYRTDYLYDVLNNLTSVTQQGGRVRTFTYDSLSRLTCAANPEVTSSTATPAACPASDTTSYTNGTILYTYDSDGNVTGKQAPAPNQTLTASLTTSYFYDNLHRLTSKTYSDGSTSVLYAYDGATLTTANGCIATLNPISPADANPIGYRTFMCDAAGAETWSRDSMGRILRDKRLSVGSSNTTQTFIYAYNKDGSEATLQYPSGRTITYAPNAAGRIVSAKDVANGINYLFGTTYAPQGALASFTNHALINAAFSYNSRLQPLQIFYGTNTVPPLTGSTCPSGPGNIMHRVYHFGLGASDNGNVQSIDNCRDTNRTVTYAYDSLNRVQSATTQGTTCTPGCWGQLFGHMSGNQYVSGYDSWGNLHEITATQGSATTLSQTMTNNNQFVGMTYDSAGNLTNDGGGHTYTYDSENRLAGTAGWTYVYDGDGKRIKKCSSCSTSSGGTLYWMGNGTEALVESNLAGTLTYEYIFFSGKRVARRDNTGNPPTYYFADHLGSTDVVAGSGGVVKNESDYYPFGGEVVISNTLGAVQNYKFTGKERDGESGLDNFGARHFGSSLGRFMTPDWSAKPQGVPYAVLHDPQSLNLYAYVQNNPLNRTDPDGHYQINASGCSGKNGSKCQKKYDKVSTRFEEARQKDLKSKDSNVRTAVAAYGDRGVANGVHVGFENLLSQGKKGKVDEGSSGKGKLIDVEVKIDSSLKGKSLEETVAHEGSHVGNFINFLTSYNFASGIYGSTTNFTGRQTEFGAYQAGAGVSHEHGFGPNDTQKINDYITNHYEPNYLDNNYFPNDANFPQ